MNLTVDYGSKVLLKTGHLKPVEEGHFKAELTTKGHEAFHAEKDELLEAGIRCSHYLQTDDTGARHQAKMAIAQ